MNVLDLSGPAFLEFYFAVLVAAAIGLVILRTSIGRTTVAANPEPRLDAFELALLAGGAGRCALLAVATLVDRGQATLSGGRLTFAGHAFGPNVHAIERALLSERPSTLGSARLALVEPTMTMRRSLEQEGLLIGAAARSLYQAIVFVGAFVVIALGVAKIAVGVSRHRPIEYLFVMVLVAFVGGIVAVARPPHRTTAGDADLKRRRLERPRGTGVSSKVPIVPDSVAAAAVALWGLDALSLHPAYADFRRSFATVDGGGDFSSSGGDSGGGGGGDGGGGCGGGGCGGCGGGD